MRWRRVHGRHGDMQQFEAIKYQAISEINNPLQTDTSSTRNVVAKPRSASSADALFGLPQMSSPDRVAMGCYQPTAPTDPYVRALAHTVPQFMASLRV